MSYDTSHEKIGAIGKGIEESEAAAGHLGVAAENLDNSPAALEAIGESIGKVGAQATKMENAYDGAIPSTAATIKHLSSARATLADPIDRVSKAGDAGAAIGNEIHGAATSIASFSSMVNDTGAMSTAHAAQSSESAVSSYRTAVGDNSPTPSAERDKNAAEALYPAGYEHLAEIYGRLVRTLGDLSTEAGVREAAGRHLARRGQEIDAAVAAALQAARRHKEELQQEADKVKALGTAALRAAAIKDELAAAVRKASGDTRSVASGIQGTVDEARTARATIAEADKDSRDK